MAEALRPLTLLLGGATLWALCLLVLALAGLGTRFPPPAAAAAPPPLPKVSLARTQSRLGGFDVYAEVVRRPVMNEGRRPAVFAAASSDAGTSELDVTLSSVLLTSRLKMALLTDNKDGGTRRVRLGDMVEGSNWRLVSLEPRRAVLDGPGGQRTLELRVFDGSSGEAPTPMTVLDPTQPQPVAPQNPPTKPAVAQNAQPAPAVNRPDPNQMSQEQQVEAIRRRIEARRAQMRAEAEAAAGNNDNR